MGSNAASKIWANPIDIASLARYLASDEASFVRVELIYGAAVCVCDQSERMATVGHAALGAVSVERSASTYFGA